MNKSEKIIKKVVISFSIIVIILIFATLLFDYFDLKKYFPFITTQYDWLGIIGAIIGGLIGSIGTYIGIYLTIRNEREENKKKEIEENKRKGYSYLTFTDNPVSIIISLDSILTGILDQSQSILIGGNVEVVGANYFDIELNFQNLNDNYPTAVMIEDMQIRYDSIIRDNQKLYDKGLDLFGYQKGYKQITMKNTNILAFQSRVLINNNQLSELKDYLLKSEFIDVITTIKFINANGIVTTGRFSANLIKDNNVKIGNKNCLGSNKEKINYKAENTYLTIKNIEYVENYSSEIFGS